MTAAEFLEHEWHDWRRQGVGGSDIAVLIGLSRYSSPTRLFYEKTGILEPEETTARQRIGKRMEAVLAAEFTDHTGLHAVDGQAWCVHPEYAFARCTVDAFAADHPGGRPDLLYEPLATVEYKTDGRFSWPEGIPANIRAQAIWQMGVTQIGHGYVVVMFAGFRVEVFEIDWDADVEADWVYMLTAAAEFWARVEAGDPPPVDDHEATTAALTEVFRDPAGILDADDDARALVRRLQMAKLATKAAEATEATVANELRLLLGDRTELVDGWTTPKRGDPKPIVIASWREQTSNRVDPQALRNAEPEIANKFTVASTSRVLRVAPLKGGE